MKNIIKKIIEAADKEINAITTAKPAEYAKAARIDASKTHDIECNRVHRIRNLKKFKDCSESELAVLTDHAVSFETVNSLALYAQDKVLQVCKLIANNDKAGFNGDSANKTLHATLTYLSKNETVDRVSNVAKFIEVTLHKSSGTASSQASSSLKALQAFGVVDKKSGKYKLVKTNKALTAINAAM